MRYRLDTFRTYSLFLTSCRRDSGPTSRFGRQSGLSPQRLFSDQPAWSPFGFSHSFTREYYLRYSLFPTSGRRDSGPTSRFGRQSPGSETLFGLGPTTAFFRPAHLVTFRFLSFRYKGILFVRLARSWWTVKENASVRIQCVFTFTQTKTRTPINKHTNYNTQILVR